MAHGSYPAVVARIGAARLELSDVPRRGTGDVEFGFLRYSLMQTTLAAEDDARGCIHLELASHHAAPECCADCATDEVEAHTCNGFAKTSGGHHA